MGVEYAARLVVGLPHGELVEYFESLEDEYDWEKNLECVSPYFDADWSDSLFAVVVESCPDYWRSEVDEDSLQSKINVAHQVFKDVTGKSGRLYLSTYGS